MAFNWDQFNYQLLVWPHLGNPQQAFLTLYLLPVLTGGICGHDACHHGVDPFVPVIGDLDGDSLLITPLIVPLETSGCCWPGWFITGCYCQLLEPVVVELPVERNCPLQATAPDAPFIVLLTVLFATLPGDPWRGGLLPLLLLFTFTRMIPLLILNPWRHFQFYGRQHCSSHYFPGWRWLFWLDIYCIIVFVMPVDPHDFPLTYWWIYYLLPRLLAYWHCYSPCCCSHLTLIPGAPIIYYQTTQAGGYCYRWWVLLLIPRLVVSRILPHG